MALTTVDNVKAVLAIPSTNSDYDIVCQDLINRLSRVLKAYCMQNIEAQTILAEYHSGDGTETLQINEMPVVSVTNIWEDADGYFGRKSGGFADADKLVETTDYVLEYDGRDEDGTLVSYNGQVRHLNNRWPSGTGNIKVSYVAGYTTIPLDLTQAITMFVARLVDEVRGAGVAGAAGAGPITMQKLGDYQVRYLGSTFTETSLLIQMHGFVEREAGMLERFRRQSLAPTR